MSILSLDFPSGVHRIITPTSSLEQLSDKFDLPSWIFNRRRRRRRRKLINISFITIKIHESFHYEIVSKPHTTLPSNQTRLSCCPILDV
ncbi:hypothetical protein OIU79_000182 [Salix purpurea]|uniref:Uncharacterized protein n=1 Tax=Salix purpurea TaxID=77065 RepID=A0A9Q0ZMP1_SALPP|nr:hypothetical protein OIU79_000182 [Salix purpurea]